MPIVSFDKLYKETKKHPDYYEAGFIIEMACLLDQIMKVQEISTLKLSIKAKVGYGTVLKALQGGNVNLKTWFKLFFALGYKIDPVISLLGDGK